MCGRNSFENKIFWKSIIKKTFKELTFFLHPVSFYGQNYEKQKGSGTSYQSPFRSQNMFRKIPFLVIITWAILMV